MPRFTSRTARAAAMKFWRKRRSKSKRSRTTKARRRRPVARRAASTIRRVVIMARRAKSGRRSSRRRGRSGFFGKRRRRSSGGGTGKLTVRGFISKPMLTTVAGVAGGMIGSQIVAGKLAQRGGFLASSNGQLVSRAAVGILGGILIGKFVGKNAGFSFGAGSLAAIAVQKAREQFPALNGLGDEYDPMLGLGLGASYGADVPMLTASNPGTPAATTNQPGINYAAL